VDVRINYPTGGRIIEKIVLFDWFPAHPISELLSDRRLGDLAAFDPDPSSIIWHSWLDTSSTWKRGKIVHDFFQLNFCCLGPFFSEHVFSIFLGGGK